MDRTDRARLSAVFALYAALALAWAGFAAFDVPPRLAATNPGPLVEALKPYLHAPPRASSATTCRAAGASSRGPC